MYTTVFWCRVRNDREREDQRRFLEATLVAMLPPGCDAVVATASEDANHLHIIITWDDRETCASFLDGGAFDEWKQEAARRGVRLHGPFRLQRAA